MSVTGPGWLGPARRRGENRCPAVGRMAWCASHPRRSCRRCSDSLGKEPSMFAGTRSLLVSALSALLVSLCPVAVPSAAFAETEYRRGPDPTATALEKTGPLAYSSYTV